MAEPNVYELARRQSDSIKATERLTQAVDRLSARIDALPDTIDRTYVRKDVASERAARVDASLASLAETMNQHAKSTQEQFDRVANTTRWVIAAVLIPIVIAIIALLSAHGRLS